ncbi:MAG: hydroxymethylglutaryl-CoA lyase [Synergistaceae bacterium]|jgi:hydroxymethylglutaryl-CoA lyase|nr:hydroxymethylglutaryl-CoA lyase [Synergistaceae bacterium]
MSLPPRIAITEVCPRDGWQNFQTIISTADKIAYIEKMIESGVKSIEITSYVHPKYVPQMADADQVTTALLEYAKGRGVALSALTLNKKGVVRARALGMTNLGFVISASMEHNRRNANKTTEEAISDFEGMAKNCGDLNITLGIACAFGSPFGEEITTDMIFRLYDTAQKHGVKTVGLADSAGVSTPDNTRRMLQTLVPQIGRDNVVIHLHDTRGMGLANAFVAMDEGISRFETALGAMGGCPYIPGAKGNIATEDLVWMAEQMGVSTGMNLERTVELSLEMTRTLGAEIVSSQAALAAASR